MCVRITIPFFEFSENETYEVCYREAPMHFRVRLMIVEIEGTCELRRDPASEMPVSVFRLQNHSCHLAVIATQSSQIFALKVKLLPILDRVRVLPWN